MPNFELICVGDELLDGRISDANAVHLGDLCFGTGSRVERVAFIRDDVDRVVEALRSTTAPIVVVSGGLGPTEDDKTREAAARFSGRELVENAETIDRIRQRFEARGYPFTENNRRQAFFPDGAAVLRTDVGTAPGFELSHDGRRFFFFPGVPREFRWYCERHLQPLVGSRDTATARTLYFHGLGESAMETLLGESLGDDHGVAIGYRAAYPVIELKLVGPVDAVAAVDETARETLGPWLVGEDDEDLPARIGRLLLEHGATVTTAESCTAGGIAALITETPGSSGWFQQGFVTYANDAKSALLGVQPEVLLTHGAVSAETVLQMASGARRAAGATYALAVSGLAGPGGGSEEKPVGTVHFALAAPEGNYHRLIRYRLPTRGLIRAGSAYSALSLLLWRLEDRLDQHTVSGPFSDDDVWRDGGVRPEEVS